MTGSSTRISKVAALAAAVLMITLSLLMTGASTSTSLAFSDGAAVYKAKCASCHAADGSGNTPAGKAMKLRDLRSAEVQKQSDDQLYNVVAKGKGKMPAYEKGLGAASCKELVAYMRKLGGR